MEKSIEHCVEFLSWLPVGYMIVSPQQFIPENFIEVNGQRLSKLEFPELFDMLRGNVIEENEHFVLPKQSELCKKFPSNNGKIILKIK